MGLPDDLRYTMSEASRIEAEARDAPTGDTVPQEHYARTKTHLYARIETLRTRAEMAETTLRNIASADHDVPAATLRTLARIHLPESVDADSSDESTGKEGP